MLDSINFVCLLLGILSAIALIIECIGKDLLKKGNNSNNEKLIKLGEVLKRVGKISFTICIAPEITLVILLILDAFIK